MNLSMRCFIAALSLGLTLLAGCSAGLTGANSHHAPGASGREVALGEKFKLEKDETVRVKDTDLTVQLKGVRRSWHVDGKSETVDAEIILMLNGKEQRQWIDFKEEVRIGEYSVDLKSANPFGKTSAEFIIRRV